MSEKTCKASTFAILGICAALVGVLTFLMQWMSYSYIGVTGLGILQMIVELESDFDILNYIPLIVAVVSIVSLVLFALSLNGNGKVKGIVSAVLGIVAAAFALWLFYDAVSSDAIENVGYGLYIGVISGIIVLISGIMVAKNSSKEVPAAVDETPALEETQQENVQETSE